MRVEMITPPSCVPLAPRSLSHRWLALFLNALWMSVTATLSVKGESVVVFNELHYHPGPSETSGEFIELLNQNATDIDLSGWQITGAVQFRFPPQTVLPGGQALVVAAQPAALAQRFGLGNVLGPWVGNLSNGGERLDLVAQNEQIMDTVSYSDEPPWPVGADGTGFSLVKRGANRASNDARSWMVSERPGGTPGWPDHPILPDPAPAQTAKGSLLAFYPFDQGAEDVSGNGRDGVVSSTGATRTTDGSGYEGNAYRFNGQGFIDAPVNLNPNVLPRVTIGAWVKAAAISSPARNEILSTDNGGYDRALTIDSRSGPDESGVARYGAFGGASTGLVVGPQARTSDGWVFIAGVFDSVAGRTTLYVRTNVYSGAASHGPSTTGLRIGAHPQGIEFFNGWIDNVFVFNRSLDSNEIAVIRSQGSAGILAVATNVAPPQVTNNLPLLMLLPFDQGTQDISGNNRNATTNGLVTRTSDGGGIQGEAYQFNGGGITVPLDLSPRTRPQLTFGAWVKPATLGVPWRRRILSTSNRSYDRGLNVDSRLGEVESSVTRYAALGGDGVGVIGGRPASTNDGWVFCAVAYDTATASTMLMVDDEVFSGESTHQTSVTTLAIGRSTSGTDPFLGWIDNVFVFSRFLTAAELRSIRSGGTNAIMALNVPVQTEAVTNFPPVSPAPPIVLNELSGLGETPFRVEIVSLATVGIDMPALLLSAVSTNGSWDLPIPARRLAPREHWNVDLAPVGFTLSAGTRVILFDAARTRVLDAQVLQAAGQMRWPDAEGEWQKNPLPSLGQPNQLPELPQIGFNEVQYHAAPRYESGRLTESTEQWIEIHNRGTTPVSLDGWQITGEVRFPFPAGTRVPAGGYLVVAADPSALQASWPGLSALGPWSGRLPSSQGELALQNSLSVPVDTLLYRDAGRWPSYADGGGSTLELRDPGADHRSPEAWSASDETSQATWQTYTYRGLAAQNPGYNVGNDMFQELVIGLLDAGEVLLDDVQVIESPGSTHLALIQNSSFEGDLVGQLPAKWRFGGNHSRHGRTRVVADPDQPGNQCLHLVATGATDFLNNHAETTLKNGTKIAKITVGREYEISFRAKWLAGAPLLNTRLYFNFLQRTHVLTTPPRSGTPGKRNSRAVANLGPTFESFHHSPLVPASNQGAVVEVRASDRDGVTAAILHYSANSAAWQTLAMSQTGPADPWVGEIPPQKDGTRVQFYVEAVDGLGNRSTFPGGGRESRAMYRVETRPNTPTSVHRLRLITTAADATDLYQPTNRMSNERIGATLIYDDREVFYDVGLRLKGSAFGRNNDSETGCNIEFDPGQKFRGIHSTIALERSGGGAGREILGKLFFNRAGHEVGSLWDDVTHVQMPRAQDDGLALIALSRNTEEFLSAQWKNGDEGSVWNMDLLYSPNGTTTGDPEAPKLNFPYNHDFGQPDIQNLGDDKENYRWNFQLRNHRNRDDYDPLMRVAKSFDLAGAALDEATQEAIDVEQWLRHFAVHTLVGSIDIYLRFWNHNLRLYERPSDGRVLALPWDLDSSFTIETTAPLWGTANGVGTPVRFAKVIELPGNARRFYANVLDLVSTVCTPGYAVRWAGHYGALAQQDFSPFADFLIQRRRYALSQMRNLTNIFRLTSPLLVETTNNPVLLTGQAGIEVRSFLVNREPAPTTWTGTSRGPTNFTVHVTVQPGTNVLLLEALNNSGEPIPSYAREVKVIYQGDPPEPSGPRINEWMAANAHTLADPADDDFEDWFEIYNPGNAPVDLGGYQLADTLAASPAFTVPNNGDYVIPAHGFLLVWADEETGQNLSGRAGLHVNFKLSQLGETISLRAPNGTLVDAVVFGPQSADLAEGRFPDGRSFVTPLTVPSPGRPNAYRPNPEAPRMGPVTLTQFGQLRWQVPSQIGYSYRLEYSDSLSPPRWNSLGAAASGTGTGLPFEAPVVGAAQRFFRIVVE